MNHALCQKKQTRSSHAARQSVRAGVLRRRCEFCRDAVPGSASDWVEFRFRRFRRRRYAHKQCFDQIPEGERIELVESASRTAYHSGPRPMVLLSSLDAAQREAVERMRSGRPTPDDLRRFRELGSPGSDSPDVPGE
jgi:hypothetical protein